jgi:hypothetical protein
MLAEIRLLIAGTSNSIKRHQVGWNDPARAVELFEVVQPDFHVNGKSPGKGADYVTEQAAIAYYEARGLDPRERILGCPVDHAKDGPWPAAGHKRNARMYREKRPTHAAFLAMGNVGTPISSGTAGMLRICQQGLPGCQPVPVVVYRKNGVELPARMSTGPLRGDLVNALAMVRGLYRTCPTCEPLGKALRAAHDAEVARAPMPEVLAMVAGAAGEVAMLRGTEPRLAPWLDVVAAILKRW